MDEKRIVQLGYVAAAKIQKAMAYETAAYGGDLNIRDIFTGGVYHGVCKNGLILGFSYGHPNEVITPFGSISIHGGGSGIIDFISSRLADELGLVCFISADQNMQNRLNRIFEYDEFCGHQAYYHITRVCGEEIPIGVFDPRASRLPWEDRERIQKEYCLLQSKSDKEWTQYTQDDWNAMHKRYTDGIYITMFELVYSGGSRSHVAEIPPSRRPINVPRKPFVVQGCKIGEYAPNRFNMPREGGHDDDILQYASIILPCNESATKRINEGARFDIPEEKAPAGVALKDLNARATPVDVIEKFEKELEQARTENPEKMEVSDSKITFDHLTNIDPAKMVNLSARDPKYDPDEDFYPLGREEEEDEEEEEGWVLLEE